MTGSSREQTASLHFVSTTELVGSEPPPRLRPTDPPSSESDRRALRLRRSVAASSDPISEPALLPRAPLQRSPPWCRPSARLLHRDCRSATSYVAGANPRHPSQRNSKSSRQAQALFSWSGCTEWRPTASPRAQTASRRQLLPPGSALDRRDLPPMEMGQAELCVPNVTLARPDPEEREEGEGASALRSPQPIFSLLWGKTNIFPISDFLFSDFFLFRVLDLGSRV